MSGKQYLSKRYLSIIVALFLGLFLSLNLQAAIPRSIHVQAFLTDNTGAAVTGSPSIRFCLYDSDLPTVTTTLWCDTRTVTVSQGVLSVQLDEATTPFPLTLFDNPLFLGIQVATDSEMSPRVALGSEAFSFRAGDADTVGGQTATSLNQSAHVLRTDNPHSVTALQTGAATAADLNAHLADSANPHNVTAAQIGAVKAPTFSMHAGNPAAHHPRYTDAEAIVAMGTKANTNPFSHDRYSDSEAVSAIKAADGAGSTLDADLVDGLQANEIILAAQDEVRTPISSLPFVISLPGSYYLTGNLVSTAGTGNRSIDIQADNVTLDLMGFAISGGGVNDDGINLHGRSNITIRNGTVEGFGMAGIYQAQGSAHSTTLIDIKALNNGTLGTTFRHAGISVASSNSHIERCVAGNNGGSGIVAGVSSVLIHNTAFGNAGFAAIYGNGSSIIRGNTAHNNAGTYGIYGSDGSVIGDNTVYGNSSTYALYGGQGSTVSGNAAYNNTGSYAIYSLMGLVKGNTVLRNTHWGIYVNAGAVVDNTINLNNLSNTTGEGGLEIGYETRTIGNILYNNKQNNIYVYGSRNVIEDNFVDRSTNGIHFALSGNFYANNRATSNTTNFSGSVPAGAGDGGGNVSF